MRFFVYILEAIESKKYYIGQTCNLEQRVRTHNSGRVKSSRPDAPWKLKWWKEYPSRSEAVKMEMKLKKLKKRTEVERFVRLNDFSGCGAVGPEFVQSSALPTNSRILEK